MRRLALIGSTTFALAGCNDANGPGRPANAVDVTFRFCSEGPPDWFAYQDSGRAWVSVPMTASTKSVTFPATPRVGIAMAKATGAYWVQVYYVTAAEVQEIGCPNDVPIGSRRIFAPIMPLRADDYVAAALGGGSGSNATSTMGSMLSVENVPDSAADLLGVLIPRSDSNPRLTILRHNVDLVDGATMSLLDFTSAEAMPFARAHIDVGGNTGGNHLSGITRFVSARRTRWTSASYSVTADTFQAIGVAGAQLGPNDYHRLSAHDAVREVTFFMHALHDTSVAFGAFLAKAVLDTVATSPLLRLRMRVQAGEYRSFAEASFGGNGSVVGVLVTSGFLGGAPETWDITVPELPSPIAENMIQPGQALFSVMVAWQGRLGLVLGDATPNPGDVVKAARGGS